MMQKNIYFDLKDLKHLGKNVIIGKTVRIRKPEQVSIGDGTIIDDFTYISCAAEIGACVHIASNVTISGGEGKIFIGDFCGISAGSSIHIASSDYKNASLDLPSVPREYRFGGACEDIVFEDHVLLGSLTVVLPGVYLPEGFASAAFTRVRKQKYEKWTLYGGIEHIRELGKREYTEAVFVGREIKKFLIDPKNKK